MMPGIGFTEMVLLVVVAIVVIGPKDLPLMMRRFGQFTGKIRAMAFEFKQGFDELGRQAELEELRKEVAELKKHTGIDEMQAELEQDRAALEKDMSAAAVSLSDYSTPEAAATAESKAAELADQLAATAKVNGSGSPHEVVPEFRDDDGVEHSIAAPTPQPVKQDAPA